MDSPLTCRDPCPTPSGSYSVVRTCCLDDNADDCKKPLQSPVEGHAHMLIHSFHLTQQPSLAQITTN